MDLDTRSQEHDVIGLVRELVRELAPQRLRRGDVTLASRLDRDLGIDSLARTELILRIERAFRVRLSVTEVAEMESVRDLLGALGNAAPGGITAFAPDVAAHAATAPIGPRKGSGESISAADAPLMQRMSCAVTRSADSVVQTTCTSLR